MNIGIEMENQRQLGPVLRTADRMRLEGCVNALTREGLCLSLQCGHEVLLDHYVRLLLTRLRENSGQHQIEVYFPANADSLLERFNAVLADQSVRDATRSPSDEQPVRVWVVHDAQKVPESEMQLLARLIQNFPGARVRALLLFHGGEADSDLLATFGRKLLRWDIELPSPQQALDALEVAAMEGRQTQMAQLLRRLGCLPDAEPLTPLALGMEVQRQQEEWDRTRAKHAPASESWLSRHLPQPLRPWLTQMALGVQSLKTFKVRPQPNSQPAMHRLFLGVGMALVLTLVITAWVQPQAFTSRKADPKPATSAPESDAPARQEPAADKSGQRQGAVGVLRANWVKRS